MILLLLVFALSFCYAAFTGFSLLNFLIGFIMSLIVVAMMPQLPRSRAFSFPPLETGSKVFKFLKNVLAFLGDFIWDLTISNIQIAVETWRLTAKYRPTLIYVPVEDLTDFELTLLSSRITLTPGTLSADVTADRRYLIVHVMYPKGTNIQDAGQNLRRPVDLLRRNL